MVRKLVVFLLIVGVIAAVATYPWDVTPHDNALVAFGTLEARNIDIGSKVGGRVTEVSVREGDVVAKGQMLVVFDDAELAARVLQARGRVEWARANVEKMERG